MNYLKNKSAVGAKQVVTDPALMQPYSHDEVTDPAYHHMPEAVVYAETAEQVAFIVKLANEFHFPSCPAVPARALPVVLFPFTGESSCP